MDSALTRDRVPEAAQSPRQLVAGKIARQPQTVITSSRVKWSLTMRGMVSSSKWHRNGVTYILLERGDVVGFGEDRLAKRTCGVATRELLPREK